MSRRVPPTASLSLNLHVTRCDYMMNKTVSYLFLLDDFVFSLLRKLPALAVIELQNDSHKNQVRFGRVSSSQSWNTRATAEKQAQKYPPPPIKCLRSFPSSCIVSVVTIYGGILLRTPCNFQGQKKSKAQNDFFCFVGGGGLWVEKCSVFVPPSRLRGNFALSYEPGSKRCAHWSEPFCLCHGGRKLPRLSNFFYFVIFLHRLVLLLKMLD